MNNNTTNSHHSLPGNLRISAPGTEKGDFEAAFLANLSALQWADLEKAAHLKADVPVGLTFFKNDSKGGLPHEIHNFQDINFDDILRITFSGDTVPYLHSADSGPEHYVSVVLWYI